MTRTHLSAIAVVLVTAALAYLLLGCGAPLLAISSGDEGVAECQRGGAHAGGLAGIGPDGTGAMVRARECVSLSATRAAAQIARSIEVGDGGSGPASRPRISTADSASYALSLVNVRPRWPASPLTGEADGLNVFVRQGRSDSAAILANVGVRSGFATTLEALTFSADEMGRPVRAVRSQLGVVNSRDGGEYGLVVQAAAGDHLSAGLRIASAGNAGWANYLEAVDRNGTTVAAIHGEDGSIVAGTLTPNADRRQTIGSPQRRYAATYTQLVQLAAVPFVDLPKCGDGHGDGTLAYVADAESSSAKWNQVITGGGGTSRTFVKCDGTNWRAF